MRQRTWWELCWAAWLLHFCFLVFLTGCGNPGNHLAALLVLMYNVLVHVPEDCEMWKSAWNAALDSLSCLVLTKGTAEVWQRNTYYLTAGSLFTSQWMKHKDFSVSVEMPHFMGILSIFTPLKKATGQKWLSLISAVILPKMLYHWQSYQAQLLLSHFGMLWHKLPPLCPDRPC